MAGRTEQPRQSAAAALRDLKARANPADATFLQRFFRTGPGEYGAGDHFLGIRVPVLRKLARDHAALPVAGLRNLLHQPWHEARLLALLIMVRRFERGSAAERDVIGQLYLDNLDAVNNWDLVDSSAPYILGAWLQHGDRSLLYDLARHDDLWRRRIAIIATFRYIRADDFEDALRIAELLVNDKHDLIHKAVGWMLREIGNRDRAAEEEFLRRHCRTMPRTMLRYAIEKFPPALRTRYLQGTV
jgi:3-methyladenine DNA glycosylase AlkD